MPRRRPAGYAARAAVANMKRQAGFSLVELMVTIAVLGIILGIAAPSFQDWITKLQIRNAAEAVLHGLQLARTEAIKRNGSVTMTLTGGTGWSIIDSGGATIQARPNGEGSKSAFITVTSPSSALPFSVTFSGLGRVTAPATGVTLSIVGTSGSDCTATGPTGCLVIQTSIGGQVHMCNPSPTMYSTPQAC